jgi:orotate phosphoribosyltransferase
LDDKGHVGVRSYGRWCKQVNKDHGELEEFVLRLKKNNQLKEEDPNLSNIEVSSTSAKRGKTDSARGKEKRRNLAQKKYGDLESLNDMDFQKEMMSIIRSEHLYHPGHFHWGKSSRSHNWIDTISLLNDRKYIIKIQSKIRSLIKEIREKRNFKYDIIIGIGMEGNIMSTQLLLEDIPYAYLPYTYRYDEFNDFEKSVCLSNSDDKYKNVLIITDVVNKGRMLRNLITEKEEDFFADVEHIHVVSLFYTGQIENNRKQKNTKIIMPDGLKDITKKIEFYPLLQLEVGKCPYGDEEFEEQCTIYKNHLCEVYKFYNE